MRGVALMAAEAAREAFAAGQDVALVAGAGTGSFRGGCGRASEVGLFHIGVLLTEAIPDGDGLRRRPAQGERHDPEGCPVTTGR